MFAVLQPATQVRSKDNSFGIVEYTPQSYVPSDLDLFARNFTPKAVGYRPTLDSIDGGALVGGNASFDINGESNLDFTCVHVPLLPSIGAGD